MECHLDSGVPIGSFPYDFESRELAENLRMASRKGGKSSATTIRTGSFEQRVGIASNNGYSILE